MKNYTPVSRRVGKSAGSLRSFLRAEQVGVSCSDPGILPRREVPGERGDDSTFLSLFNTRIFILSTLHFYTFHFHTFDGSLYFVAIGEMMGVEVAEAIYSDMEPHEREVLVDPFQGAQARCWDAVASVLGVLGQFQKCSKLFFVCRQ